MARDKSDSRQEKHADARIADDLDDSRSDLEEALAPNAALAWKEKCYGVRGRFAMALRLENHASAAYEDLEGLKAFPGPC